MSATLEIPFAIGEELWRADYGRGEKRVTCPECAGTRVIEMTKGNGERLSLDCGYCSSGYDAASGVVTEYVYDSVPVRFIPMRVAMNGDEFTYSESPPGANAYASYYAKDLYRSREECEARCAEINAERKADDEQREIHNLASKRRSLAFSATYWSRQLADLRRKVVVAEARLARCKVQP